MSQQKMTLYSVECKERAVTLAVASAPPLAQTARDLGIHEHTWHTWRSTYPQGANGPQGRLDAAPRSEDLKRLQQENALFKEERDLLHKAAADFAVHRRESPPGGRGPALRGRSVRCVGPWREPAVGTTRGSSARRARLPTRSRSCRSALGPMVRRIVTSTARGGSKRVSPKRGNTSADGAWGG
jgi:transposase-like protein